jgi:8-oxo-dGTP pyrophosphatase MutT (NUDIX family)
MHREKLLNELYAYRETPLITPQEKEYFKEFVRFIKSEPKCFERTTKGHITSAAWIVSHDQNSALLTHHRKLNMWVQLGGHNDGDPDCASAALREAQEESGIEQFTFIMPTIFDIDIHPLPSACTFHYDIRYLLQAPANVMYKISDESLDLAWVPRDQLQKYSCEASILRMNQKFALL